MCNVVQAEEVKSLKRKEIESVIVDLISKKRRLQADVEALTKSSDSYADLAEQKGSMTLITKANSMRRSAKSKATELSQVSDELSAKELELKNLA